MRRGEFKTRLFVASLLLVPTLFCQAPEPPKPPAQRGPASPRPPGPPPPPPGGPAAPGGRSGVARRLGGVHSTGATTDQILVLAKAYLEKSAQLAASRSFASNRTLAAADALVHAAEHQSHLAEKAAPELPEKEEVSRHLEQVYFRLQQADYFVKESADGNTKSIAGFARGYYQNALRALERDDRPTADECAKSVEDLMRALESLAQAAVPVPIAPKLPPGPPA